MLLTIICSLDKLAHGLRLRCEECIHDLPGHSVLGKAPEDRWVRGGEGVLSGGRHILLRGREAGCKWSSNAFALGTCLDCSCNTSNCSLFLLVDVEVKHV